MAESPVPTGLGLGLPSPPNARLMQRFEIQEMVSQSKLGVTYLARDKDTGRDAALRRFFPYGKNKGLNQEQIETYRAACERLIQITHTHLRFVLDGGVDAADGTPYLATEWIQGSPLDEALGGKTLDPRNAMDVLREALEVSLELSRAFNQEAVWVETKLSSIIVAKGSVDRGCTFWLCPRRFFNVLPELREVSSIAILAEELLGWNKKLYGNEAGYGLGAWIKAIKQNRGISVTEALERLRALANKQQPTPTAKAAKLNQPMAMPRPAAKPVDKPASPSKPEPTPPTPKPTPPTAKPTPKPRPMPTPRPTPKPAPRATPRPAVMPTAITGSPSVAPPAPAGASVAAIPQAQEKSKSFTGLFVMFGVGVAAASAAAYFVFKGPSDDGDKATEKLNSPPKALASMDSSPSSPSGLAAANRASTATLQRFSAVPQNLDNLTKEEIRELKLSGELPMMAGDMRIFKKLKLGSPAKLQGVLKDVIYANHEGEVRFIFSDNHEAGQVSGLARSGDFEGELSIEMFKPYVGKQILINGFSSRIASDGRKTRVVQFSRLDQIRVAEE